MVGVEGGPAALPAVLDGLVGGGLPGVVAVVGGAVADREGGLVLEDAPGADADERDVAAEAAARLACTMSHHIILREAPAEDERACGRSARRGTHVLPGVSQAASGGSHRGRWDGSGNRKRFDVGIWLGEIVACVCVRVYCENMRLLVARRGHLYLLNSPKLGLIRAHLKLMDSAVPKAVDKFYL